MFEDWDDVIYDPTRRWYKIYSTTVSVPVVVIGAVGSFCTTISTLGVYFGDHNNTAALINLVFWFFFMTLWTPVIFYCSYRVSSKREVYEAYRGMNRTDRKKYKKVIRSIHRDSNSKNAGISYSNLIKIFNAKALNNANSVNSMKADIESDLKHIARLQKLKADNDKIVDELNKGLL